MLSETINKKRECIWDLVHYRFKPSDIKEKTHAELDKLSSVEGETIKAISKIFGMKVFVRTRKGGDLVAIHHGWILNDKMIGASVRFLNDLTGSDRQALEACDQTLKTIVI